jgi:hypothetical protein
MMRLKDKSAIAARAAKGLGRKFCKGMAKEGAPVMEIDR